MKKTVVWVDERTHVFLGKKSDFSSELRETHNLEICGEGQCEGNRACEVECIDRFKKYLDSLGDQSKVDIAGFILDINIPVENLGQFSDELSGIGTGHGAYTGFQLARYVLGNEDDLSPYEDRYKNLPVLYLSISGFGDSRYTRWMKKDYVKFDHESKLLQYSHLEKSLTGKATRGYIVSWASKVANWKYT